MSTSPMETAEWAIRLARSLAETRLPWLAPALFGTRLILRTRLILHPDMPVLAGIDAHGRVYFNSDWVAAALAERPRDQVLNDLAFVWYHEVAHLLRDHRQRAEDLRAAPKPWNVAADAEINDQVPQGLSRPQLWGLVVPADYGLPEGRLAEWYYHELTRAAAPATEQPGTEQPAAIPPERASGSPTISSERNWGFDAGSGIDGVPRDWEAGTPDSEAEPGLSDLEQDLLRRKVALEIQRAAEDPALRGTVPAGWDRWASEILQPRIDWRKQFARSVRGAIRQGVGRKLDYAWTRPSRRADALAPFVSPILQGHLVPRVAVVVDTSGSISPKMLEQFLGEVGGMLLALQSSLVVIPCDAVPYEPVKVFSGWQLRQARLEGGGGTDMVQGIEAALRLHPAPDTVVVLTDGYTPFPTRRYYVPVVFGILKALEDPPTPPIPPFRPEEVIIITPPEGVIMDFE